MEGKSRASTTPLLGEESDPKSSSGSTNDEVIRKRGMYNIYVMSLSFMILFTAYNTIQNYVTTLLEGSLGNVSLAILYASVALSVVFAPFIVKTFGEKVTMIIGAFCYVVYMATLVQVEYAIVCIGAVVIGCGSSVLWVGQGSFLTKNSNAEERGTNSGIFWGIFQICNVIGNLLAYSILDSVNNTVFFTVFMIIGAVGTLCFFFLRPVFPRADRPFDMFIDTDVATVGELCRRVGTLSKERTLIILYPMFFWTGFELSFWTGEFPQLLEAESSIGLVLALVGITEVIGGYVLGRLSDSYGRSVTVIAGTIAYCTGLGLCVWLKERPSELASLEGVPWIAYVAAIGFGIGDCAFNTQVFACLGELYEGNILGAWTLFQLVQNVGSAVGYWYAILLPLHGGDGTLTQVWVQVVLAVVSCALFVHLSSRKCDRPSVDISNSA